MSPPLSYPFFAPARTPRIIMLLLHPQISPSSSLQSANCTSPRRHWYADSADNDIHCLHYSLGWREGTAVRRYAHTASEDTVGFTTAEFPVCLKTQVAVTPNGQRKH